VTEVEPTRRMSARDVQWLAQEDATQPMHGGLVLQYAGHLSRDQVRRRILDRLPWLPRLRQKMVWAPFGIATPSWQDDPIFDIDNHVHELTLPAPADDRVLGLVAGQLHAQLLDRQRPVWDMTLLHGHSDGNTSLYFKMHHAAVDAPALMGMLPLLHDGEPGATGSAEHGDNVPPEPPDPLAELQTATHDRLAELLEVGTEMAGRMRPDAFMEQTRRLAGAMASLVPEMLKPLPSMPWNGSLGPERQVAWTEVPLQSIRDLARHLGGTINDTALTVLAGGLARYLRHHGYSTQHLELRDMVTVSVRRPEERGALGNRVTAVFAPLYVGIDDPLKRFAAERAAMNRVKEQGLAEVFDSMSDYSALIPPVLWQMAALPRPSLPKPPISLPQPAMLSVISSNVVGPRQPLHLLGHELVGWKSIGICMLNVGLFAVMQSYADRYTFSVTVDPALVPDEWQMMDAIGEAYAELQRAAADRAAARTAAAHERDAAAGMSSVA
jgi:diacylglycerol O-acyltransferase / wax synthase